MAEIAIAAAIGAAVSAASYSINYALAPKQQPTERGRLQGMVQVQDSSYGQMIPIILGGLPADPADVAHGMRVAGNIIWMSNVRKHENTTPATGGGGGGKGGGGGSSATTTITYDGDLAIMLGEGELELLALYADADLIFDNRYGALNSYEGEDASNTRAGTTSVQNYSTASAGQELTLNPSASVQFNNVRSASAATRELTIRYRTGNVPAMAATLWVNGVSQSITLPASNESFISFTIAVALVQGTNTIKIQNNSPTYNLGIDRILCYAGVAGETPPTGTVPLPGSGTVNPTLPPDNPIDPFLPPDPTSPIAMPKNPDERFNFVASMNAEGEMAATLVAGAYSSMRFYAGTETQGIDPIIEADLGVGKTPAYLGRSFVVLEKFDYSRYGRVPNFTAVVRNKNVRTLAQVLTTLAARSNVDASDLDVTAFASTYVRGLGLFNRTSLKQVSENTLAKVFALDWTQKNGKLTAVQRSGTAAYTIPQEHLGYTSSTGKRKGGVSSKIKSKLKLSETNLPRRIDVKAFDPGRDFEINTGSAWRQVVNSQVQRTEELNIVLTSAEMKQVARRLLKTAWREEREDVSFTVPHTYAPLVPTDVVEVSDGVKTLTVRIKEITGAIPGSLTIAGVPVKQADYSIPLAPITPYVPPPVRLPATVIGTFINVGFLRDRDTYDGRMGYYVAATSLGNGDYRSANVYRNRGTGWELVCELPQQATMGRMVTTLNSGSTTADVDIYGTGELESYDAGAVAEGSGYVVSGDEVYQYTSATPIAGGAGNRWRLSGLTNRGARNTSGAVNAHVANERFVLLNNALRFVAVEMTENAVARPHKFVALGMGIDDAPEVSFTWTGAPLTPPTPSGLAASVIANKLRWSWNPVADPNRIFSHYEAYRDAGLTQLLYSGDNTYFTEDIQTGVNSYTVYLVAVAKVSLLKSAPTALTSLITAVPDVTGFTATWDGLDSSWTWTEVANVQDRVVGYNLYTSANTFIGFQPKPPFVMRPTTASTTLKIKAVDILGNLSANYGSYTLAIANPAPPASAASTWDGQNIIVDWPASVSAGVVAYEVQDGSGNVLATNLQELFFKRTPTYGQSSYTFRAFAINRIGLKSTTYAQTVLTMPAPSPPATAGAAFNGLELKWTLTASPSVGVSHYLVKDGSGTLLADKIGLEWTEKCTSGVDTYTRRFYAVNNAGIVSTSYTETTFTVPAPSAPATYVLTCLLETIAHDYTAPATLPDGLEYELARANDGTNIIGRRKDFHFDETGFPKTSRLYTRYIRSINIADKKSGWLSASASKTAPAAPTLTQDTARATPVRLPVQVATATSKSLIRSTVLQVRAPGGAWPSIASGTSGTYRFAGAPGSVDVLWTAGGAVEFRIAHEDDHSETLSDHQWSATQSYTFPRFNDGAIDPASVFLKKSAMKAPVISGGDVITWTSDFKVKWSADILITGLPAAVSSSHTITIAANTTGTTLAAGERLVAVHTMGATTASLSVVTLSTYEQPDETSNTTHYPLFERGAGSNVLKTYLGQPLDPDRQLDVSVLIPRLTSFIADLKQVLIDDANINELRANKIVADTLDAFIVFADYIGSRNFIEHGSASPTTETLEWTNPTGGTIQSDGTFVKTAAGGSFSNAGVRGARSLYTGAGSLTMAMPPVGAGGSSDVFWGYSYGEPSYAHTNIEFAMRHYKDSSLSQMYVYESGVNKIGISCNATDKGKIVIGSDNSVKYYRVFADGSETLLHTSVLSATKRALVPMAVSGELYSVIPQLEIYGCKAPLAGIKVHPRNAVYVGLDAADDFYKSGGTNDTWGDAGFSTGGIEVLPEGQDGGIEFVINSLTTESHMVGLSTTDADQNYASIGWAALVHLGNLTIYESGTARTGTQALTVGDRIRIAREGGVIVYRRNGVIYYTSTVSSTGAQLIVDTSLYKLNSYTKSLRLFKAGALGQGWQATPNGPAAFNNGVSILDVLVDDLRARSVALFNSNGVFLSTDADVVLPHKITAIKLESYGFPDDGLDECTYQISVAWPMDTDDYANTKSVRQCQVRVLNHFHEEVRGAQKFTFLGDGTCAEGRYKWKYAHPAEEAVFALKFYNGFGWSKEEVYMRGGIVYLKLSDVPRSRRTTSPQELNVGRAPKGASFGWRLAADSAGAQSIHFRKAGQTAWQDSNVNLGSTINETALPNTTNFTTGTPATWAEALSSNTWYEVRVKNTTTGEYSNIVRFKTHAPYVAGYHADEAPFQLRALVASSTSVTLSMESNPVNFTQSDDLILYRLKHSDGTLTKITSIVGTAPPSAYSKTDTVTAGETYTYWVVFNNNGTSKSIGSEPVTITMPQSSNKDPYGFYPAASGWNNGAPKITWKWSLGSSTGNITFQWAYYDAAFQASPTWTDVSLGSTTATEYTLNYTPNAANDAIIARVKVADAGTLPSNTALGSGGGPETRDY